MKFSIRDMLLVTVIVALAVGWWVDRANYRGLREENERLVKRLDETDRWLMDLIALFQKTKRLGVIRGATTEVFLPTPLAPAPNPPKP